jgi:glycosyltransferase involved in cell wall biosynthesis
VEHPQVLSGLSIQKPYALVIASHRPHKRLAELCHSWEAAAPGLPLVLVGRGTDILNGVRVRGLGYVSNRAVEALLASATCLVSGSEAEGFGLPILAAMSAAVPVVATRCAALEEVAADVPVWVPKGDFAGLVQAAARLGGDDATRKASIHAGLVRARHFTAERAAESLQSLLEGRSV